MPPLICIICPKIFFLSVKTNVQIESESGQFGESVRQFYDIILIKALTNQFASGLTMGIPVHQIISALEDQMNEVEEDGE